MDTNFSIVNSRIHATHREILEVRAQFIQLDEKINRLDERINRLEVRLDERINRLDERINGLDHFLICITNDFIQCHTNSLIKRVLKYPLFHHLQPATENLL